MSRNLFTIFLFIIFIVLIGTLIYIDMPVEKNLTQVEKNNATISNVVPAKEENIKLLPPAFIEGSNQKGTIEKIEYETYNYSENNEKIVKPAYVYLPYGYNENDTEKKYDVVYLMHGYTESAERFFMQYETYNNYNLQNVLDNMIANGDIKPVIVVTPTFDANNASNTYEKSIEEINVFHKELVNELIPAVEGKYHTYAESTDKEGIKASREHRAFGGFSMGAATTWNQVIYNLDYIKYFLPMSGDCWIIERNGGLEKPVETAQYLEKAIKDSGYKNNDFLIYSVTGKEDMLYEQVNNQINAMIQLTDIFNANNLKYKLKEDGVHDYNCCIEYVYGALQEFFPIT